MKSRLIKSLIMMIIAIFFGCSCSGDSNAIGTSGKKGTLSFYYSSQWGLKAQYSHKQNVFVSLDDYEQFAKCDIIYSDSIVRYGNLQIERLFLDSSRIVISAQVRNLLPGSHSLRFELLGENYSMDIVNMDSIIVLPGQNTSLGDIGVLSETCEELDGIRVDMADDLRQLASGLLVIQKDSGRKSKSKSEDDSSIKGLRPIPQTIWKDVQLGLYSSKSDVLEKLFGIGTASGELYGTALSGGELRGRTSRHSPFLIFKTSSFIRGGRRFEIFYLYTNLKHRDGTITDDERTPMIFINDKLAGWGWDAYDNLIKIHGRSTN